MAHVEKYTTMVLAAITEGDLRILKRLFGVLKLRERQTVCNSCACPVETMTENHATPFACVLAYQKIDPLVKVAMYDVFLRNGLRVNEQLNGRETCLSLCCTHGDRDLPSVKLLLEHGADPNLLCGLGHWNALFRTAVILPQSINLFELLASEEHSMLCEDVLAGHMHAPVVRYILDYYSEKDPDVVVRALEALSYPGMFLSERGKRHYTQEQLDSRFGKKDQHAVISRLIGSGK